MTYYRIPTADELAACGTRSAYNRGCRCPECREAQRLYDVERQQRRRRRTDLDVECPVCGVWYMPGRGNKHVNACLAATRSSENDVTETVGEDWRERAKCLGVSPELFYAERGEKDAFAAGRAVCAACPVREECLQFALVNNERFGMWGGKSPRERQQLRRTQGYMAKRCKTCSGLVEPGRGLCDSCKAEGRRRRLQRERVSNFVRVPAGFADGAALATELEVWQAPSGEDRRRAEAALAASDFERVEGFGG